MSTSHDRQAAEPPGQFVWNPLDPGLAEDPYRLYKRLRDIDPVYQEKAYGWWFVTGHDEALRVLREPDGEMRFLWFQQLRMGRDMSDEPYCRSLRSFLPTVSTGDHRRIRDTFKRHFTPRRVQAMREGMTTTAYELIDRLMPRGRADLHEEFAVPLPLSSISRLLAIPADEQQAIAENVFYFKLAIQFPPMSDEDLAKANRHLGALTAQFEDSPAGARISATTC